MYAPSGDVNTICLMTSKENLFACEIFSILIKNFPPRVFTRYEIVGLMGGRLRLLETRWRL